MGVVVNVVVARGAGVFQLLNMEPVRNGDIVRVDFRRSSLHIKDPLMTADAIWIDLVKFGGKTGMLPFTFERKDINAWHHGVTRRMALRAVNLRMQGRLLPERRFPLLVMTGNTKLLFGCRIGGQGDGRIKSQYCQDPCQAPGPKRKMWDLKFQRPSPLLFRQ